jgi:hypothetical protein
VIPRMTQQRRLGSLRQVLITRCWTAGSGPMGCLGDDDVVRDATIQEMSQAVFSASPLGVLRGYISRPIKAVGRM